MSGNPLELSPDTRMDSVDALRGYALMGLLLIHGVEMYELYWLDPQPGAVSYVIFGAFMAKSFSLLALCFGLSFFIIMDRAAKRGEDFSLRFGWRLLILLAMGWAHGLIYNGEILQILAPVGLVLLALDRIRSNMILIALAGLCFVQPFMLYHGASAAAGAEWANQNLHFWTNNSLPIFAHGTLGDVLAHNAYAGQIGKWWFYIETGRIVQIVGLFIVGLVLGRIGFFRTPDKFRTARRLGLVIAIACGAALQNLRPLLVELVPNEEGRTMARTVIDMMLGGQVDLFYTFAILFAFVELYHGFAQPVLRLLAPFGRMTLTMYVSQSLLLVPVYFGFGLGLYDDLTQAQALSCAAVVFVAQVAFAHWWLKHFHYGPLEWAWRALTYLRWDVPFARQGESARQAT